MLLRTHNEKLIFISGQGAVVHFTCWNNKPKGPYNNNPCVPPLHLLSPDIVTNTSQTPQSQSSALLLSSLLWSAPGKSTLPSPLDKKGVEQKQDWIIEEDETEKEEE